MANAAEQHLDLQVTPAWRVPFEVEGAQGVLRGLFGDARAVDALQAQRRAGNERSSPGQTTLPGLG